MEMPKRYLHVPFHDKDAAKRLGAHWDDAAKLCYVPEHVDLKLFTRWQPEENGPNMRADYYFIAATTRICWHCQKISKIHGFILAPGLKHLHIADDPQDDEWETYHAPSLISYVTDLTTSVSARMAEQSKHYRITYSDTTQSFYWMNRCEHCGSNFDDYTTFCELGQGFGPLTPEEAALIKLTQIDEPFAAHVGTHSIGIELFECMQR